VPTIVKGYYSLSYLEAKSETEVVKQALKQMKTTSAYQSISISDEQLAGFFDADGSVTADGEAGLKMTFTQTQSPKILQLS
jgi:hypothetical protein